MLEGLYAVFGGMWFVVVTPRVWLHAMVPAVMLLALLCVLSILGVWGAWSGTWGLIGEPEGVWGHIGGWLLAALLAVSAIVLATLLAIALAQPLSGFALESIALAQERSLLGENLPRSSFLTALWVSTRATMVMLVVGGLVNGILLIVDLCFPPAVALTAPLRFVSGAYLLAWNFLDYPLSLRGLGVWARLCWAFRHFDEFTVFGLTWAALLVVPGLFILILPMGVAGATRLVIAAELEDEARAAYEDEAGAAGTN